MLALIVLMSFIPLNISGATFAFTLLPVMVLALTQDFLTGLLGGVVMGVSSLVMALTVSAGSPTAPIFQNPLISVLPRIIVPVAGFAVMKALSALAKSVNRDKEDYLVPKGWQAAIDGTAALAGVLTNTGLVLGLMWAVYGGRTVGETLVSPEFMTAMISVNFVVEAVAIPLLTAPVTYAIRKSATHS